MKKIYPDENIFSLFLLKRIRNVIFFLSLSMSSALFGQTTNISGIVNTYHSVIEIIPAKACLRVANVTGLNVNTRVMVVQMKGATVNTSNNSSFGTVTAYNDAGNYEIGTICYIIGDSVFLFHNLLNSYDAANGKVQLVQFAEYFSADVVDTIKAAPWNNSTGTGGVIALFADQDITLNAPVYAGKSGYAGGNSMQSSSSCSNGYSGYIYNPTSGTQGGAYKGESITTLTTAQSGGRGSPASGGGGGNNHNNSGGGGANLSAGGDGGGNSSGSSCNATYKGIGGKALSSNSGQKIFMGGGGGAGHYNYSGSSSYGGNGGGVIFIWANNIIGNNKIISADGAKGGNSASDGAGGGGGGGTIILHSNNYTGSLIVSANGGDGGDSNDGLNLNYCYGGGGGGSGGVIYFTGSIPPITTSVNKGAAGLEISRHDPSCGTIQPASDGSNGQVISSYAFSTSTNPAGYCSLLLPSRLLFFETTLSGQKVLINWKVLNPESVKHFIIEKKTGNYKWIAIGSYPANDTTELYKSEDLQPEKGYSFYRLKVIEKDNHTYYSDIRMIAYGNDASGFTFYPNPATKKIFIYRNQDSKSILQLTDLSGKLVLRKEIIGKESAIVLPLLPQGLYFLQIDNTVKKLIIR